MIDSDKTIHKFSGSQEEKPGGLFYKTPPNMALQNYATKNIEAEKKYIDNSKDQQTGTRGGCYGTSNPRVTQKQYNLLKGIQNIVPNGTRNQWPHVLAVPA